MPSQILSAVESDPLTELRRLGSDEDRGAFFRAHPYLVSRETVEQLTKQATSLLRVDPRDAERVIDTSAWLAEKLGDDHARARSFRAAANLAHVKGNQSEAIAHYALARNLFTAVGDDFEAAITASSSLQALAYLGRHDQAMRGVEFARAVFERRGDRLRLARLNANYASILYHRERWAEAATRYEDAYRDFLDLGEKQDVAVCLGNMAVCHFRLHDFTQALDFYQRTRAYYQEAGLTALVAELDYNIAYLHYLRGQYTTALELYRAARSHHSELGIQHHVDLCAMNEAEIYLELNLTAEAADLATAAYSGFHDRGLAFESAKSLTILAIAQNRQGKPFLALDLLSKAQDLFPKEKNDLWVALLDFYKASIFLRAGRPYEARRLATQAGETFRRFSPGAKSAACEVLLARLALREEEQSRTEIHCKTALEDLRGVESPALAFEAAFLKGEAEAQTGRFEAALQSYLQSHEQLERMTASIQTEEQRISAIDDKLILYEAIAELLLYQGADPAAKARLFAFIEKAKSRTLTDLLAFRAYTPATSFSGRSKLADQVRQLREELNWYYRQIDLQEMRLEERSPSDVEELRRYSRQQESRLIHTLHLLEQTDQEFISVQQAFSVDLDAVQSSLPQDTTLLEFFVARGTVIAAVVNKRELTIVPLTLLSTVDELRQALGSYLSRATAEKREGGRLATTTANPSIAHLGALYQELLAPIAPLLTSPRLVIVPHGSLFYLPFHAFHDGHRFLGEDHSVLYFPSATTHHFSMLKERGSEPAYDLAFSSPRPGDTAGIELTRRLQGIFARHTALGGASAEAAASAAGEAKFLHLFTDARFRSDNPMFSSIRFGDATVHIFDLFQMRLKAEVVALEGCSPGVEADAKGNELVGLVRGLLYSGARTVLGTLWPVSAAAWSDFVCLLFTRLKTGEHVEEAFAYAVNALRADNTDPRHWAPFVLFGSSRPAARALEVEVS